MKTNFWKSAAAFVLGMAAMVACDSTEIQAPADPTFPSLITNNYVGAGETLEISFDANYAWDVEVSDESYAYFKLIDGEQEVQKISGAAGAGQSVKVKVTDIADDNNSYVGEIYMTMNGITKKVAYYVLPGKLTTVSLYPAILEEWEGELSFAYNEDWSSDLTYAYETVQTSTINLINIGGFYPAEQRALMEAHFDWTVEKDDWLTVMIQGDSENEKFGTPGTHEIWFRVDPAVYPANGADTKITFKKAADQSVVAEYRVILQPAPVTVDIMGMYPRPLTFDQFARVKTNDGFMELEEGQSLGSVSGTKNIRCVAIENANGAYNVASWVNVSLSEWDATEGNDGIQERELFVSVQANNGAERTATLFVLPEMYADVALSQLFDANGVKEEYAKYSVSLTQVVLDYITFSKSNEELAASFASYEKVTSDHANASLLTDFNTDCVYKLTYADPFACFDATFSLLSEFAAYEILDAAKQPATEGFWVALEGDYSDGYNVIANFDALPEVPEAYVVFKDANNAVLGVIYVLKGEKAPGSIVGDNANYFGLSWFGGSMVELTSGEVYDAYKSHGCPIFHLTYDSWSIRDMPISVVIPSYDSYEVTETSNASYYKVEVSYEGADPTIMMMLPEDVMNDSAVLVFKKGEAVVFVLQCTYAMPAW